MKIIYMDHYAGSIHHGMEYRPYYLAREWMQMGHEVLIVAASYSHIRKVNPEVHGRIQEETIDGIPYLWIRTSRYDHSGAKRAWTMAQFCGSVRRLVPKLVQRFRPDVVISSSTYPLDHGPAYQLARASGAVLIHEVHDLWPLSPMEIGKMSPRHPFIRVMQRAEDRAYRRSDAVVSLLPGTLPYMTQHGLSSERWHYIPNGVVASDWRRDQRAMLEASHQRKIDAHRARYPFIIGYAGGLNPSNAMQPFVEALSLLHRQHPDGPVGAVIVGQGSERETLEAYSRAHASDRILFLDPIPKPQIPDLLSRFDSCYLGWLPSRLYDYGTSPNKIFDYMMASKPIVHAFGYPYDLVQAADCGVSVREREQSSAIAQGILAMAQAPPEQRERWGQNGYLYVQEHHLYHQLATQFTELMESLMSTKGVPHD